MTANGEVEGTATLLRRLPENHFRLMSQEGEEAFFHRDEFKGGFIHHPIPFPLRGTGMPEKPDYWIAVVRFQFGKPVKDEDYTGETYENGEHRMILYMHVDKTVVQEILDAVVNGIWGKEPETKQESAPASGRTLDIL
jgi:hypothetical protein